ncbi:DNA-binding transcriptional activator of the SARP family [Anaerovirgula multivorans]|uniref:DNA-binding transcriptional activator of the SARP family n=1 Tax=Anaerovirgula multivorans TaxID=312168 RepID=A0A239I7S7_9FIRM|nr:AAA family ATPase [Anaerovirgula multivorans]SNS89589.1 DNA-binding transcriptional activator of the SARP family [Anaerovirgula multivorans]
MTKICVKLFSTPTIEKDHEKIFLPFRKAEALFYYLVVQQQATRDELVNLLWGEVEEETAKKNLRHAMYKIRKVFDMDIIISPQKSIVMLNPEISIESDLKVFLQDEENNIEAYKGEFLQGFLVKDAEDFENWISQTRETYRDLYITKLYKRINEYIENQEENLVEQYTKLLIHVDAFNERAYRILMEIYKNQGNYNKAIDIYHRLCEVLEQELGITPDNKTKEIFEEILMVQDSKDNHSKDNLEEFFYGRNKEIQMLNKNFKDFIEEKTFKSMIITGEAGIGKTKLKDKVLQKFKQKDVYLLQSNCYQAEEEYFLKPWNTIFTMLFAEIKGEKINIPPLWRNILASMFPVFAIDDTPIHVNMVEELNQYKYRVMEEAVIGLFKRLSQKKKVVIVFEDLQWIDTMSLSLLNSILLQNDRKNIFFIGTCRDVYLSKIDGFMTKMKKYDVMEEIYLPRFAPSEVADFIYKALPNMKTNEIIAREIYRETEGNTFFIMEYLNSIKEKGNFEKITPKMQDILKSRFLEISKETKKLLNIISLFFDKASLDILQRLMDKDELEVMNIIEELQDKRIIMEIEESDKISFQFTHSKLREFIYMQQSSAMRRVLHSKVASILEDQLKHENMDKLIYSKLIYHFSNAGDKINTLKYSIKNVNTYMDFTHEVIPVLNDTTPQKREILHVGEKELVKYLQDIEVQVKDLSNQMNPSKEMTKLQIEFFHIMGRYLIAEGEYEKGIHYIEEMIQASKAIGEYEYTLRGYRQMINYCIQTHNIEKMQHYVEEGLQLSGKHSYPKEEGILLRLKGLNKMMEGQYQQAEEFLKQSINIFKEISRFDDKYLLNIAAAYNYIGEIRRYNMMFSSALSYYDKAMMICDEQKIIKGLTMFNTNAGQAAFDMGDYDRAKDYFQKAIVYYRQLEVLWGRSIAEGYMALLLVREGQYKEALQYLKGAEVYARKLKSPYEMGLIYRIMAEIRVMMKKNKDLNKVFYQYLRLEVKDYCRTGIAFLSEVKDSYEKEIMKVFIKDTSN